ACEGHALRRLVALALLAPLGGTALLAAEAVDGASERLGLDALLAPRRAPSFVSGARRLQVLVVLAHGLAEAVEEGAVILQPDGIHGAAGLGRALHVLVAGGRELLELALELGHLARGLGHRAAQLVGRRRDDFLYRLESLRFRHEHAHYRP